MRRSAPSARVFVNGVMGDFFSTLLTDPLSEIITHTVSTVCNRHVIGSEENLIFEKNK